MVGVLHYLMLLHVRHMRVTSQPGLKMFTVKVGLVAERFFLLSSILHKFDITFRVSMNLNGSSWNSRIILAANNQEDEGWTFSLRFQAKECSWLWYVRYDAMCWWKHMKFFGLKFEILVGFSPTTLSEPQLFFLTLLLCLQEEERVIRLRSLQN